MIGKQRFFRIESGFRAAFFLLLCTCLNWSAWMAQAAPVDAAAPRAAFDEDLAQASRHPVWAALLHLKHGQPQISDPGFLLSQEDFSPERELRATLVLLQGPRSAEAACRFPARAFWLHQQGLLPAEPDTRHCAQWQEFLQRAPATHFALAFAAEILSQPSSMMGHLFLKVEGQSPDGRQLDHAISFYTDAGTWNIPLLFYESMVEGKAGYFALSPFREEVHKYAAQEQRSLWTYRLALDGPQRRRLQAHIHELRQTRITYFFQDYNCATLVRHMLAVARPDMLEGPAWWTTPKDVLRQAQHIGLIDEASVQTPARWQVRSLAASLPAASVQQVRQAVEQRTASEVLPTATMDEQTGFLSLHLAQALLRHQARTTTTSDTDDAWRRIELDRLRALQQQHYPELQLNADARRDPAFSPPERQASIGWLRRNDRDHLQLRFMPISHTLSDDNRQHLSENELRLFDSSWLVDVRTGRLSLDRLTIYSVQSLLPWDSLTGGLSGRFKLGIEPQPNLQRPDKKALLLEGAIGRTWRLADDLDAYVMLGGGWGWRQRGHLYGQPEAGVVIREIWNMKTQLSRQVLTHPLGEHRPAHVWTWTQSMYLPGGHTWEWRWQRIRQKGEQAHEVGLTYKHLF